MDKEKILKAGKISAEVKKYARSFIKKDIPLLEIAEKIEDKIIELGGKIAFPTNLSINEIAAHYTPSYDDETKARGLLKIDLGVHVDGWISDTAFSMDLEDNEENRKLIEASKQALENASKIMKKGVKTNEIGRAVQETIESKGFTPVRNLSGHQIEHFDLHAGLTIPNFNDNKEITIEPGLYAIEPFATDGSGKVYEGRASGIYILNDTKNVRSPIAREILKYIQEEYKELPFCSRWLVKKFGAKALFGLRQLEEARDIYQFEQLVEAGKGKVAQTEQTFLVEDDKTIITSKED